MIRTWKIPFYISLALIALVVAIYLPVRNFEFLDYDDNIHIYENPLVLSGLSVEKVVSAFTQTHVVQWIPLAWVSHMLDVSLFGLDPGSHHLVSVFVHTLNVVLLFLVIRGMTGATWKSACVAALFAVHPLNVESVAWAAERKSVLCTFFWILGIGAYTLYVRRKRGFWLALTTLCMACGLGSKPMIVTFPFTLLLLDFWPLRRDEGTPLWKLGVEKLPLFAISAFGSVIQLKAAMAANVMWEMPFSYRFSAAAVNVLHYLRNIFFPIDLSILYPLPRSVPVGLTVACIATILGITLLAWRARERIPALIFGWLWFLGVLVPVSNLIGQSGGAVFCDRFLYVPQIGCFVAIIWGLEVLLRGVKPVWLIALTVTVLTALISATASYLATWRNTMTAFENAAAVTKNNFEAHIKVGFGYARQGDFNRAAVHYREAIIINPDFSETRNDYGVALSRIGDIDGAIAQFRIAARLPNLSKARFNLATHLLQKNEPIEATRLLVGLVSEDPDSALRHYWLGRALEMQGATAAALIQYKLAHARNPSDRSIAEAVDRMQKGPEETLQRGNANSPEGE